MEWDWASFLGGSVGGAVVSAAVQYFIRHNTEGEARSSAKQVIQAVLDHAEDYAATYLKPDGVASPGGRLETDLYGQSMEILLGLRVLTRENSRALLGYLALVQTFNRSLDMISDFVVEEDKHKWAIAEVRRAKLKAIAMLPTDRLQKFVDEGLVDGATSIEIKKKLGKYKETGTPYDRAMSVLTLL
jgi:hypothetical protein